MNEKEGKSPEGLVPGGHLESEKTTLTPNVREEEENPAPARVDGETRSPKEKRLDIEPAGPLEVPVLLQEL